MGGIGAVWGNIVVQAMQLVALPFIQSGHSGGGMGAPGRREGERAKCRGMELLQSASIKNYLEVQPKCTVSL